MFPRKLIILDSSLINTEGHHYEYAKAVTEAARERGLDVRVLGHRHVTPSVSLDLDVIPIFGMRIYDSVLHSSWPPALRDPVNGFAYAIRFVFDWLRNSASKYLDSSSVVFVPTCTPATGLALAFLLRFGPLRHARTVCLFRFDPKPMMSFVVRLLRTPVRRGVLSLGTDSELLADEYGKLTGLEYVVFPIPHTPRTPLIESDPRRRNGPLTIAFLGDARLEKGVDILDRAIPLLDEELRTGAIEMHIQCSVFMPEPGILSAVHSLRQKAREYDRAVTLLSEPLSSDRYYQLLIESDIIVLPYRENSYLRRTSGVLVEAVAVGKPVIVTDNTWMWKQVERYGAGFSFRDDDPADLAHAIRRAIREHDQLCRKALAGALEWRGIHNASGVLDLLMIQGQHNRIAANIPSPHREG